MKNANLAMAIMVMASLVVPTVHAKTKSGGTSQSSGSSQAGGLPATNARLATLEATVVNLQADLAALKNQSAAIPPVFVAEGSLIKLTGSTAVVATKQVPAGTYLIMATVQLVNSQRLADAKARCVMKADGTPLADTSDLLFPILTTAASPPSGAWGSTIFAPLQSYYSSKNPITILVECSEGNGGAAGVDAFVNIAALKVTSVQ